MTNTLFTTVGQVFLLVAVRPDSRVREIALHLGVTERTVMHSLQHLTAAGLVKVRRRGRRNIYEVDTSGRVEIGPVTVAIGELIKLVGPDRTAAP